MADPCWDDGLTVVPDIADGAMDLEDINFILDNNLFQENPAFRHYIVACLQPHIAANSAYDNTAVLIGRQGLVRWIYTPT